MKRRIQFSLKFLPFILITILLLISTGNLPDKISRVSYYFLASAVLILSTFFYLKLLSREKSVLSSFRFLLFALILTALGITGLFLQPTLHTFQGEVYKKEGRYNEAVSEYQKGNRENLTETIEEIYMLSGDQELSVKNYEGATSWYKKVTSSEKTIVAHRRLAGTYLFKAEGLEASSNYTGAIVSYKEVIGYSNPAGEREVFTSRNLLLPAISTEGIYQKLELNYARAGDMYLSNRSYDLALESFNNALLLNQNSDSVRKLPGEQILSRISKTYLAWGEEIEGQIPAGNMSTERLEDLALDKYKSVIDTGFNSDAARKANLWSAAITLRKGDRELLNNNFDGAINLYQRSVSDYKTSPNYLNLYLSKTYLAWGKKLLLDGDPESALLKLEPNYELYAYSTDKYEYREAIIQSYAVIGQKLILAGKYDEAITRLEPAFSDYLTDNPNNPLQDILGQAYLGRGVESENTGAFTFAIDSYKKALVLGKEKKSANTGLARLYMLLGNQDYLSNNYENAFAYYQKAQDHLLVTGEISTYAALSQKLATINSVRTDLRTLEFYRTTGKELEAGGNYTGAIESYEQGLVFVPTSGGDTARRDLYQSLIRVHTAFGHEIISTREDYTEAAAKFETAQFYAELIYDTDTRDELTLLLLNTRQAEAESLVNQEEEATSQQFRIDDELRGTLLDAGLIGCSFVPGIGVACNVGATLVSIWRGDWLAAGLSIIGAIPFLGDLFGDGARAARISQKISGLEMALAEVGKFLDNTRNLLKVKFSGFASFLKKADKVTWKGPVKLNHLPDPPGVGVGKEFSQLQKQKVLEENIRKNGGVLRSDCSGKILVLSEKLLKSTTVNFLSAEIDHIFPQSLGGTNSYSNAQVLSKEENLAKGNQNLVCPLMAH